VTSQSGKWTGLDGEDRTPGSFDVAGVPKRAAAGVMRCGMKPRCRLKKIPHPAGAFSGQVWEADLGTYAEVL